MRAAEEEHDSAPLIDTGNSEEVVVTGLGAVREIGGGWAEFEFFRRRGRGVDAVNIVKVRLIAPIVSVAPAFDLCLIELGADALNSPGISGLQTLM